MKETKLSSIFQWRLAISQPTFSGTVPCEYRYLCAGVAFRAPQREKHDKCEQSKTNITYFAQKTMLKLTLLTKCQSVTAVHLETQGILLARPRASQQRVIYSDFPLDLRGFFLGKHFIHFLANRMQDFLNFVLCDCIVIFYAEKVYLKLQNCSSHQFQEWGS